MQISIWNSFAWKIFLFSHIYSFIYGYEFMDISFMLWDLIQHFFFVLQNVWVLGAPSLGSCIFLAYPYFVHLCVCLCLLPDFLTLHGAPGSSSYTFLAQVLELSISLKSLGSFYERMVSETQIWTPCMSAATKVKLLLGPLSWQS